MQQERTKNRKTLRKMGVKNGDISDRKVGNINKDQKLQQ